MSSYFSVARSTSAFCALLAISACSDAAGQVSAEEVFQGTIFESERVYISQNNQLAFTFFACGCSGYLYGVDAYFDGVDAVFARNVFYYEVGAPDVSFRVEYLTERDRLGDLLHNIGVGFDVAETVDEANLVTDYRWRPTDTTAAGATVLFNSDAGVCRVEKRQDVIWMGVNRSITNPTDEHFRDAAQCNATAVLSVFGFQSFLESPPVEQADADLELAGDGVVVYDQSRSGFARTRRSNCAMVPLRFLPDGSHAAADYLSALTTVHERTLNIPRASCPATTALRLQTVREMR